MTFLRPKYTIGEAKPFDGTDGQRAANRLSHSWKQVENPIKFMPIPARWAEQLSREEAEGLAKPPLETLPKCEKCGCWGADNAADWPCGEAPRFGEVVW